VLRVLPALGLPPAIGEHVLEEPRGRLPQLLPARNLQVEALVNDFLVFGHCSFLSVDAQG
jgi:hypothetical protein